MKHKILHFLSVLFLISYTLNAQIVSQKQTDNKGLTTSARFNTDSLPITMNKAKDILNSINKIKSGDEWRLEKSDFDKGGTRHQYYQQYYKGVRVAYGTYAMHGNNKGELESAIGNYQNFDDVNITPQLSEAHALQYAMKYIGAEVYKWQIPEEEKWIKENSNESYFPKGELLIVRDILQGSNQYRLAYKFDIYAHKPISRNFVYVDAMNGKVLDKDSRIHQTNSPGTANTRYSGTRNITTDSFNGGFRLRETRNNVRIETYNMHNTGTYSQTDFIDNDNNWVEHNNTNRDNAGLDAHWGAEMVVDYFRNVHGRNSYNGNGAALFSYVNSNLPMINPLYPNSNNAFWDGNKMTYGIGTANPLTTLDICAHEITHGVTGTSARLAYRKESGAINEALSDIWAACVESWAAPDKQRWFMGEDIGAFRSMNNPNLFNHPDTYLGTNWFNVNNCTPDLNNDYCGVHINSGVINYWFFLLSEGGTGTNDINNQFWVNAIGMNNAARIVYRTQTVILQSNTEQEISIAQFREATITAASNIFGANSNEVIQIANAWHAVGVGNRYPVTITGPSTICTQATYTIQNLPQGATVQWSVNDNNVATIENNGSNATVSKTIYSTGGVINLTADISIGEISNTISKQVMVGTPSPYVGGTFNDGGSSVNQSLGSTFNVVYNKTVYISLSGPANEFFWEDFYSNGNVTWSHPVGRDGLIFTFNSPITTGTYFSFNVSRQNECGIASEPFFFYYAGNSSYYKIAPNPSSTNINISLKEDNSAYQKDTDKIPTFDQIVITDITGNIKLRQNVSKTNRLQVDVSRLSNGIYYLNLYSNGKLIEKKTIQVAK